MVGNPRRATIAADIDELLRLDGFQQFGGNRVELGEIGVAEKGGEIRVGDVVIGVNQTNTRTMNYAQVLDLIVGKPRPIELHFERKGTSIPEEDGSSTSKRRVMHVDWNGCRDGAEEDEVVSKNSTTTD